MTNKIDSLYELIKEQKDKKGRPLKIICDWDETIQPLKPSAIYEKMVDPDVSFETFFETFWEKTQFSPSPSGRGVWEGKNGQGKETIKDYSKLYTGSEKEKEAIREFQKEKEEMKNSSHKWDSYAKSFYGRLERFEQPFLSPAKDLFLAVKEDLIKEIVIISSYNVGKPGVIAGPAKTGKQQRTFGQFPFTKIEYTPMYKKGKVDGKMIAFPLRHDVIKDKYSDFDIFIDDSSKWILETKKYFPDRTYVIPDYKSSRKVEEPNVYRLKMSVSDLRDEDFTKVAQEYKDKKVREAEKAKEKEQRERERERERERQKLYWMIGMGILLLVILGMVWRMRKKQSK